jgi:hypothetical protein
VDIIFPEFIQKIPPEIRNSLFGFIFIMFCWVILRPQGLKSSMFQSILNKTKKSRDFLFFICNLLILEIGTVISLYTMGNMPMTEPTIRWILALIWITLGIGAGMVIIILYEAARFYWKYRGCKNPERYLAKIYNRQYKELEKAKKKRQKECQKRKLRKIKK